MADRFTVVTYGATGETPSITLYDERGESGPQAIGSFFSTETAQRVATLLNDDWEADQPADTPEAQRAIIYKQLTTRHRIALIALLEGATRAADLGVSYPASIVTSLRRMDLLAGEENEAVLRLNGFGRRIAEGVLKRRPKAGYKA